ncbi:hypothetical protein C2S51_003931 [Perilla frutescens var. frutescens]|nr:hypothetical protein C2S51_003931 [Perilla frutescens var. frutescens]
MVRSPCFDSNGMKKGAWSEDEDNKLRDFVLTYGHWNWRLLPKFAGLKRCGKSCRLRWVNHLKPGVKRGNFSKEEEDLIIKLHSQIGNKWSAIATELPGRTDNDIKNFWHTRIARRQRHKPSQASSTEMEHSSLDATSVIKTDQQSIDHTKPQIDAFCYPELHYTESSCSHSSHNMTNALDCIIPHEDYTMIISSDLCWDEYSYALINYFNQSVYIPLEEDGESYDPLFCLWD